MELLRGRMTNFLKETTSIMIDYNLNPIDIAYIGMESIPVHGKNFKQFQILSTTVATVEQRSMDI